MNWRFNAIVLTTILVSLFSCKSKEDDNIKLQSDVPVGAFFVDDFPLTSGSIQYDSSVSGHLNISRHLVGVIDHEDFGKVTAAMYSQINLPVGGFLLTQTSELVSCDLYIHKNYYFGQSGQDLKFAIHKLGEQLVFDEQQYYTFDNADLGIRYGDLNLNSDESSFIFPVPSSLAKDMFDIGYQNIENQDNLNNYFSGITIQPYEGDGVLGFDLNNTFLRLIHVDNGVYDTADFYMNDEVAHFNRITYDRSTTNFLELNENGKKVSSSVTGEKIMIQAGASVEGVINFSNINENYYNSGEFIYKAELEIPVTIPSGYNNGILDSTFLYVELRDSEGIVRGNVTQLGDQSGIYDFDITKEIQEVFGGGYQLGDIRLVISRRGHSVTTFVVDDPNNNIKLKVYLKD